MTACGGALLLVFTLLSGAGSQRPTGLNKRHDVYIAGFFPFGRHVPESSVGRGVMPAVKLAVDHINESPQVLRNYRLHMWWNDTEVRLHYPIPSQLTLDYVRLNIKNEHDPTNQLIVNLEPIDFSNSPEFEIIFWWCQCFNPIFKDRWVGGC